ncbi:hypothetical protein WJX72_004364 [[Myrmecia] bisecta]|uniref:Uncharacterized protein n=1 Tax=[Myrmecia] bisecta TaxID=41462 RepID=A0AAW1R698_9CHLO
MAPLREAPRSGTVAFSPSAPFIAMGTVAGATDMSFSTNSTLEVFKVDFVVGGHELEAAGGPVTAPERFHRLAWGTQGQESHAHPLGLLAGGLTDGAIVVWDPAKVVGEETNGGESAALVSKLQKHTAAVKGLEFNSFSPNLLASGGADADLCIWDLTTPARPNLYPALKSSGQNGPGADITHLAWNRKVQHILASCSANGTVVVWDLKKQHPVISLKDNAGRMRQASVLQWNPEVATQLIVACEDDLSPTLQLWDLRNHVSPVKEFLGHNKGVLGMAWSVHDPTLLLSTGKDGRTLLWDVPSSEVLGEISGSESCFNVAWSPTNPGVFATASYGGEGHAAKVALWDLSSFTAGGTQDTINDDFSVSSIPTGPRQPLKRAPAWMKRPVGATFGFGGKLVQFHNVKRQAQNGDTFQTAQLMLQQVVTETGLVTRSTQFEEAISGGERPALVTFCDAKASASPPQDAETWAFLRVLFEEDARRHLLTHLGFEDALPPVASVPTADVDEAAQSLDGLSLHASPQPPSVPHSVDGDGAGFFGHEEDADAFFEDLAPLTTAASPSPKRSPRYAGGEDHHEETEAEAGASEHDIQRALYVGNYAAALDACLQADRMADALIIGSLGGGELWTKAQKEYMRRAPRPYMKVVHAIMENDFLALIKSRPLDTWKETLAILCAYSRAEEWADLCDALARRLAGAGLAHAATLCWICAGNVDQTVKHWTAGTDKRNMPLDKLQDLMERAVVLGLGVGQQRGSPALSDLVNQYASILASQGCMGMALEYLDMVPGEASATNAILRDRIYRSSGPDIPPNISPPPFPFIGEDVQPAPGVSASTGNEYGYDQSQYQQPAYSYTDAQQYGNGGYAHDAYSQGYNQYAAPPAAPAVQPAQQHATPAHQYAAPHVAQAPAQQYQAPVQRPAQTAAVSSPSHWGASQQQPQQPQQQQWAQQPAVFQPAMQGPPPAEMHVPQPTVFMPSRAAAPPPPPQNTAPPQQATPMFVPKTSPAPTPTAAAAPPQHFAPAPQQMQQIPQPAAPAPPPPPPVPTGPPANINITNVDTSQVEPALRAVVKSLGGLFSYCAGAPASQAPGKKREMEDNSKRLGQLFWKLNSRDVSPGVQQKLLQLCAALDAGDFNTASHVQVGLTSTDWDECSNWLTALKRLIKTRQSLH